MSTINVTNISSANSTTDLTIKSGNTDGAQFNIYANGSLSFSSNSSTLFANGSIVSVNTAGGLDEIVIGANTHLLTVVNNEVVFSDVLADVATLDTQQTFTALQVASVEAMSDGATITPTGTKHFHSVTLSGNRTLANPTSITAGATYVFKIKQDGTGNRTLGWGSAYDWAGGTAPTLSTGANDVDAFSGFSVDGTSIQMTIIGQDFS